MLSRRALIARLPIAAAPATSRRWLTPERPLAVDAGGNVEPAWTAADRANAQASAAPRKAFAMAAGVGLTTALGFYGVLCYSGDDGQETKQIEKPVSGLNPLPTSSEWSTTRTTTSPDKDARDAKRASGVTYNKSDDFASRVADTDALPNYKATVGERLGKQSSRKIYGADTDEAPDDKPYSGRAVGDQPQRQVRSGDRPARGVYEEDRTSGDYNRYVRDSPAKDPRLDSDRPIVKAEPLIAGRATQQLDEKCQLELERQGSRSLLGRLSDRLFSSRKEPAENLRDSRESESEDKFSEQQTRGISTPDVATGDAGSLYRSGSHLPQRAMAELGAKDDDDNDKDDGDEAGDGKKKNIFSKALSSVKGKFSHAANEAKDRLKGQRDSTSFDRDEQEGEDEERTYYTTGRPGEKSQNMRHSYHNPPSDETPKRYEKSSALERLKEEYEEHKDENRKKHDEEIEEAANANDLSALAGPGHYRIRTKVSSEPFTARAAADEELDRNERIRAMENWSVLQGKQVAEQGRRWRARTANQSGVETTSVTGREPIRWFSRLSNEADVKADHYATSGHGSLERRRGIGSGESDDAEEKITGTGTHGDDEAGDTGKSADVQKQQRKLDEKARKSRNASASEPGRAGTGVRDDEPLTTKQLGAQEDRETIDMRG